MGRRVTSRERDDHGSVTVRTMPIQFPLFPLINTDQN